MSKTNKLFAGMTLLLCIAISLYSCKEIEIIDNTGDAISGNITTNTTWTADRIWAIKGKVIVEPGVTLTIEPGTVIKGRLGTGPAASALVIARGAKIMAQGTEANPIVFTSEGDNISHGSEIMGTTLDYQTQNGLWGGVIILGNAPISPETSSTAQIEGIPANILEGNYGGNDPADNSGVFQYVSIRYGGALIGEGNELNGLTLGGVGNGTTIDHIEVISNLDDGIEFFGGTVNVSHAIVINQGDDAFDVDQAYAGTLDNFAYIAGPNSDHALEIDGPEGSENASGAFTFTNGSLMGGAGEFADFRKGAQGVVTNCRFFNFDPSADIELDAQADSDNYCNGILSIANNEFANDMGKSISDIANDKADAPNCEFRARFVAENNMTSDFTVGADMSEFSNWTFASYEGLLNDF